MRILLTNDDGYDSLGLHALADGLEHVGSVTIVAPVEDQSSIGRASSSTVTIDERERGVAVTGTPVDCVIVGLEALDIDADVVVSGCNAGANLGGHALGRSGTVSAAVEATFFGLPAIASSLYLPLAEWPFDGDRADFSEAIRGTRFLLEEVVRQDVLEPGTYLNLNAPLPTEHPASMTVTRPADHYGRTAEWNGDAIELRDATWERMENGELADAPDTDRGAVVNGDISVTPLVAPHQTTGREAIEAIVERFRAERLQ